MRLGCEVMKVQWKMVHSYFGEAELAIARGSGLKPISSFVLKEFT